MPKDLIISASNKSGIVKAIEHKKYKILSQMWHTERERNFDKYQVNLIKKFLIKTLKVNETKNSNEIIEKTY